MSDSEKVIEQIIDSKEGSTTTTEPFVDDKPLEDKPESKDSVDVNKRTNEEDSSDKKKKHKRRRRQYDDDLPKESKSEEEKDDEEEDDADEENLGNEDLEEDDLAEIDESNIITGRRTRGKVIDFTKAAEKLKEEEGNKDENEDEDGEFKEEADKR